MELFIILLLFYSSFTSCAAEKRIIGGANATEGQFPYYAQISTGHKPLCGAAIIHERWLLSAAHCFVGETMTSLSVAVGTIKNYGVNGQKYLVETVINHENYFEDNRGVLHNDIALVRLKSDIIFSTNVQSITLPKNNSIKFDGALVTIAGMGRTSFKFDRPSILQYEKTEVVPLDQCWYYWGHDLEDEKLCTSVENEKSTFKGDSGGPVVTNGLLIGIVSYGVLPKPDVHTRVSSYLDWINKTMNYFSDQLL